MTEDNVNEIAGSGLTAINSWALDNSRSVQIMPDVRPVDITFVGAVDNNGCAEWRAGACVKCSYRYIARASSCEPVNPLCQTWDNTGKCLTCYKGYEICAEGCLPDRKETGPKYDAPNCNTFDSTGKCTKCSAGAYWRNGVCTQSNPNCRSVNSDGLCLDCYAGYSVQSGSCVLVPLIPDSGVPGDILCSKWVGNVCHKCSVNAYFDGQKCTQVNPLCRTFDSRGRCTGCYAGYAVYAGACALLQRSPDNSSPSDLLCAQWSNGVCTRCATAAFFRDNVCVQSDPQCKTFDSKFGQCTSCYDGYYLDSGRCYKSVSAPDNTRPSDLLCAKWRAGRCTQCSRTAFFRNGVCTQSDPLCHTFDQRNGDCLSCYNGYAVSQGSCVRVPAAVDNGPSDLLCAKWQNGVCSLCSQSAYFNRNGVCTQSNPLCKTFDPQSGICLTCYAGYEVDNRGGCWRVPVIQIDVQPADAFCAKWNGNICVRCSLTAYFSQGVCTPSNPQCKTFDQNNGACLTCYSGYGLSGRDCVRTPDVVDDGPADLLCARWNRGVCVRCSSTAYFKGGVCTQSDAQCKTFDQNNGACTSCYDGYALNGGRCIVVEGPTGPSVPADSLCAKWKNGVCVECAVRSYWWNNSCRAVNPQCRKWNSRNGSCLSCFNGYALSRGGCYLVPVRQIAPVLPQNVDIYCKTSVGGVCKACFFGFALKGTTCVEDFERCRIKSNCP